MKSLVTAGVLSAAVLAAVAGCDKSVTIHDAYQPQPIYQQPPVVVQQPPVVVQQQPGVFVPAQPPQPPLPAWNQPQPPVVVNQPPQWNPQPPVVVNQPPVVVNQPPAWNPQPPVVVNQPPVVVNQPPVVVNNPAPPVIVGRPGPQVGARWVLLGQTDVEFKTDKDSIVLDARQTWKRLELTAAEGAVELQAVRVNFLNRAAAPYDVKVNNFVLTPKNPSVVIELPGEVRRNITQIDFVYKSVDPKVKHAKLTVTAQ